MSDIQDLIHKTSMDCIERGKITERERIIKLLENLAYIDDGGQEMITESKRELIELIKGETK